AHRAALPASRAEELVSAVYQGLLNRDLDEEARRTYVTQLRESGDLPRVLASIARSEEYWAQLLPARAEQLVSAVYQGLLNRELDEEAQRTYVTQLRESGDLPRVLASIARSEEHWAQLLPARAEQLVTGIYQGLLNRELDEEAQRTYVTQLRESGDLPRVLASIARSEEHWAQLPAARPEELVTAIYQGLLNRELDEEAQRTYVTQLRESGDLPRVLASIARSEEYWAQLLPARAEQLVTAIYQGLLNRELDEEAQRTYVTQLRESGDLPGLLATIDRSQEHWERLLPARAEQLVSAVYQGLLNRELDEEAQRTYVTQLRESGDLPGLLATIDRSQEHWERLLPARAEQLVSAVYQGLLNRELDEEAQRTYVTQLRESGDLPRVLASIDRSQEHWERLLPARAEQLVSAVYQGLLNRELDEEAQRTYVTQLRESGDLPRVLASIARSEEHWAQLLPARAEQLVTAIYQGLLNRELDEEAQRTYVTQLRESGDLPRVLASIARSEEYWAQLLPARAEQLVTAIYQGLLNRELDEEAQRTYVTQLRESGDLPRVLASIARSEEHWAQLPAARPEELVTAIYQGLLNRELDEEAQRTYVTQLRESGDLPRVLASIARSEEYWAQLLPARAEQLVTAIYQGLLNRELDEEAQRTYVTQLRESGDLPGLLATIDRSQEHWERLLPARAEQLVSAVYQGLLNRELDEEAQRTYVTQLRESGDLPGLLATIDRSQEHWERLLPARAEQLVSAVYQGLLNRELDEEAQRTYVTQLRESGDLPRVLASIARSEEHWAQLPAARPEELVTAIYQGLLNRELDEEAQRTYVTQLRESGDLPRVLASIARSEEYWAQLLPARAEQLVTAIYQGLLNRELDEEAQRTYVTQLRESGDLPGLLATIDRSQEHWERLLPARAEQLVSAVYQGLLNRELDEEAQRTYVTQLRESGDLPGLLATIDRSQEHWERLLPARAEQLVSAVYQGLLNRELDEEAQRTYVTQLRESGDLPRVLASIARSEEHWAQLLPRPAERRVAAVYQGLLNRELDEEAQRTYVTQLRESGDLPRVLASIARSEEHWAQLLPARAEELVTAIYQGLLNRELDEEAQRTYVTQLRESGDLPRVLASIARSEEYWAQLLPARAEQLVTAIYQGLLNRELDEEAQRTYVTQLREICDLPRLLASIARSDEYSPHRLPARAEQLVTAIYQGLLNRELDEEAQRTYVTQLRESGDLPGLLA